MNRKHPQQEPLVSVIIPAYNVEAYIEDCVSSVLGQDMEALEVIAVDDGSTDGTGRLLDALAQRDDRLRVLHRENQGVSAARNAGLDCARGKYISFVDGDDVIREDCLRYFVRLIQSTGAEFAFSRQCAVKRNEPPAAPDVRTVVSGREALAILLSPDMIVGCWNKIYEKAFLDAHRIRFSTRLHYGEGLRFITTAAQLAERVAVGSRKVYFYRRNNAQSATSVFQIEKLYSGEAALEAIESDLLFRDERVMTMLLLHRCTFCAGAVAKLLTHGKKEAYSRDYARWLDYIRRNFRKLARSAHVSPYRKGLLLCAAVSPRTLAFLDRVRRKRIAAQSGRCAE